MSGNGWIGVDLDGTLAEYHGWDEGRIGTPIKPMVDRVKAWLENGQEVRIMTARVGPPLPGKVTDTPEAVEEMRTAIEDWTEECIGTRLRVTNEKDYAMIELWDDRCVQVMPNTGYPMLAQFREVAQHISDTAAHLVKRCTGELA